MRAICILINNSGVPIGGFSVEQDSGGDRLMDAIAPLLHLLDLRFLIIDTHICAILPKELQDKVRELCLAEGAMHVDAFHSPGRG